MAATGYTSTEYGMEAKPLVAVGARRAGDGRDLVRGGKKCVVER